MNKVRLIKSVIDTIPFAENAAKPQHYWDNELKGYGLRVGTQTKAFFVQRDIKTKTYTSKIGQYGHFTPEEARKIARNKLNLLAQGIDPDEVEREKKVKSMTLRELMEEYFTARRKLKQRTRDAYRGYLKCHLSDWLDKPVAEISEEKVLQRYAKIGQKHPTVANCVKRTLGAMLEYGLLAHKLFNKNPVRVIAATKSAYPDKRRDGHLKPHQLKVWYSGVNQLASRTNRDYMLFVLFTGLRRTEALSLPWTQVDFADKTFRITETKNNRVLELPMTDFIHDLLLKRKEITGGKGYVFPGTGKKTRHLADPRKAVEAVQKSTGLNVGLHDLRRTYVTIAAALGVNPYTIKDLVNHISGNQDITHSYVVRDVENLRDAAQKIATYMQQQMGMV